MLMVITSQVKDQGTTANYENKTDIDVNTTPSSTQKGIATNKKDFSEFEIKTATRRGENVYDTLTSKYHLPLAFHDGLGNKMGFSMLLPLREWNNVSKQDQIALSFFAEHLVSLVRANPDPYVLGWQQFAGWPTDSEYDDFIKKVARMCDGCWDITVGEIVKGDRGQPDFEDSDAPVTSENAAQFRQSNQKAFAKSIKEQDADRAAEFAASMSPSDHLVKAKEAMETDYDPGARPEPRWGNTAAARSHLEAIPRKAPEYVEAQTLLREVARREQQDMKFKQEVIRQMQRIIKERGY